MLFHTVTQEEDGTVLLSFLKNTLRLSRSEVIRLKSRTDGILLDGKHVTVRAVLRAGQALTLATDDRAEDENPTLRPVPLALDILYEDEDICVCNKPSGMPTHPSHLHHEDTLANALAYHYRHLPFVFRAVQRLDRETSGVVLTARSAFAASTLARALVAGEIQKEYLAVVDGVLPREGEIRLPIRRAPDSIMVREVCREDEEGAQAAHTRFVCLGTDGAHSLARVFPVTGRTHQIRVHMKAIGHPLLADSLYARPSPLLSRTALHARRLTFPHPRTGELLTVTAPLAEDIRAALSPTLYEALSLLD